MSRLRIPELDLVIDPDVDVLLHLGEVVPCSPLTRRLLAYLARHCDRAVSSQELLTAVWRGVHVTKASVRQAMRVLRRELESAGIAASVVETVRGRGYRLACEASIEPDPSAWIADGRLPLTGRDAELATLLAPLDRLASGRGAGALITGPAGIGKTRLAEEVTVRAARRAIPALVVRCGDALGAPALWSWQEALTALEERAPFMRELPAAETAVLESILLARNDEDPTLASSLEPGAARVRLFTAIENALARSASASGLVIVIDDLHLADEASQQVFRRLVARLGDIGLFLIGTHRAPAREIDAAFRDRMAEIARRDGVREVRLSPLARSEVERLVASAAPDLPPGHAAELFARSGGNPFLVRVDLESMRSADPRTATPEPEGARTALLHILSALPESTLQLLQIASLIGLEIRPPILARVAGTSEAEASMELARARGTGFVVDRGSGILAFAHAMIGEALQTLLSRDERSALHARIARVLEVSPGAPASAVAEHAFEGRERFGNAAAAARCERAAAAATRALAFEEAVARYDQALACTDPASGPDRLRLLLGLITAASHTGRADRLEDVVEEATRIAISIGDPRLHARVVLALGLARGTEDGRPDPRWIQRIERALADCVEPCVERVRLLSLLAEARWFEPPFAHARALAMDSVALAQRERDPDVLTETLLRAYRICQSGPGDEATRAELTARLAESISGAKDRLVAMQAYVMLMSEAARAGDRPSFDQWVTRASAEADAVGGPHARWWALVAQCTHAQVEGRLDEAERLAREALDVGGSAGLAIARVNFALQHFSLCHDRERLEEAVPVLEEAVRWHPGNPAWLAGLRFAESATGRTGPAREFLRAVIDADLEVPDHIAHPDILFFLAEIAIALEERELARGAYERLLPLAGQYGFVKVGFCHWGSHQGRLGRLAALFGDDDRAERHLREAIVGDRRFGALASVARHQLALADVLDRRARSGDSDAAAALRHDGVALRRDLGIVER